MPAYRSTELKNISDAAQYVLGSINQLTDALHEVINLLAAVKEQQGNKVGFQNNIEKLDRIGQTISKCLQLLYAQPSDLLRRFRGYQAGQDEIKRLMAACSVFKPAANTAIGKPNGKIQALLRADTVTEHPLLEIISKLVSDALTAKKALVRFDEFLSGEEMHAVDAWLEEREKDAISILDPPWEKNEILSIEESKELKKERIQKMITAELLRHFTQEEAFDLLYTFFESPSASYFNDIYYPYAIRHNREIIEYIAKEIKGRNVIEIGSNANPTSRIVLLNLGAKSYNAADVKQNIDALSALARQKSESAIVVSFALFADQILYPHGNIGPNKSDYSIFSKYRAELCKHIYRVTPRGAITLHGLEADCMSDLLRAGFVLEKCLYNNSSNRPPSGSDIVLCAFRKV